MADHTNESVQQSPEAKNGEILSKKRRTALVAYLAVLFAVAFLLVALSMIIENRRLQDSNNKNTATLNGKIEDLQDEYNQLLKKSGEQENTIQDLREEITTAQAAADQQLSMMNSMSEKYDAMTTENRELNQQKNELSRVNGNLVTENERLKQKNDALQENLDHAKQVQELLFQAEEANDNGNYTKLRELLKQIEPWKDLLSPTALALYESLTID